MQRAPDAGGEHAHRHLPNQRAGEDHRRPAMPFSQRSALRHLAKQADMERSTRVNRRTPASPPMPSTPPKLKPCGAVGKFKVPCRECNGEPTMNALTALK